MRTAVITALLLAGCTALTHGTDSSGGGKADGAASDPVVEYRSAQGDIWALSDPHGGIDALTALLQSANLIDAESNWSAGDSTLVVAGDLIDKSKHSLEVIDLFRKLQQQAGRARGRVIVTMGNHEAEFLDDPKNASATSKGNDAEGIDNELKDAGIDPKDLAAGKDKAGRGDWLRALPLAARVDNYFFAHGGNTDGDSIKELRKRLGNALDDHGFGDKDIIGGNSILQAQQWYDSPDKDKAGRDYAQALGVDHIVFGHDPGAFGAQGHIATSDNHILIKIDCAMGLDGEPGQLLHITTGYGVDTAEKVKLTGEPETLY